MINYNERFIYIRMYVALVIHTNKAERNLFACFRMVGHVLNGMAPCFGHAGVTLMLKMSRSSGSL